MTNHEQHDETAAGFYGRAHACTRKKNQQSIKLNSTKEQHLINVKQT